MEKKLEQLLNSLIEKWWKPFWYSSWKYWYDSIEINWNQKKMYLWFCSWTPWQFVLSFWLRQLTSKESWLWWFVCENELLKPVVDIISICSYSHFTDDHDDGGWDETFPEYRLIESSLKDEDELESFILDNIKVDG